MVRGIYEWVLDNECTPYLLVNAMADGVRVPQQYVQDGQIILNISPTAVSGLDVSNDFLRFSGRFGGVAQDVCVPMHAVMGIYARENGQGMLFDAEEPGSPSPSPLADSGKKASSKPSLTVVK